MPQAFNSEGNESDIFDYLEVKGAKPKVVEGGEEACCNCPYCGKQKHFYVVLRRHEKNGKARLPGYHKCMKCGESGGRTKLKRIFGDLPDIWTPGKGANRKIGESIFLRSNSNERARVPSVVPKANSDIQYHENLKAAYNGETKDKYALSALAWLTEERCIPWKTLEDFKVGFTWIEVGKKGKKKKIPFIAYPYYSMTGTLINFKFRAVNPEDFELKAKSFMKWTGCESHPYGIENLKEDYGALIIVEGEQDLLAMQVFGYENVISLPDGASSWDHKWTRYLAPYEQIYICLDNDDTGQEAAHNLADKIGKVRCLNVLLPLKDANDCLMAGHKTEVIEECFSLAEPFPGGQIVEIGDFEDLLVGRLKGGERTTGVSTGYTNLDLLLCGWREEELTIITGDTGMGKTTFLMSLCEKLASRGVHTLYCPFEMKPIQLMTKLVAMRAQRQFMQLDEATVRKHVRSLSDNLPLYFLDAYGQVGLEPILEIVQYAARYLGIGAFILDPLQYALQHAGGPREREELIQAMHALQKLVKSLAIRVIMVVHPTKLPNDRKQSRKVEMDDLPGSASIKQDADNVLRVWAKPDKNGDITTHVEVTVLKARSEFARLGTATFMFNPDTLTYHEWDGLENAGLPESTTDSETGGLFDGM